MNIMNEGEGVDEISCMKGREWMNIMYVGEGVDEYHV